MNVEKVLAFTGFLHSNGKVLVRAWLGVMFKVFQEFHSLFAEDFLEIRKERLTLGKIAQFFILLKLLLNCRITANRYFRSIQEKQARYSIVPDHIDERDFRVLWKLLDEPDKQDPDRLFRLEYKSSTRCKRFAEAAAGAIARLIDGIEEADLCLDDSMIQAWNFEEEKRNGFETGFNSRKAARNGVSIDIVTACPRLNMVVGILIHTIDDREKGHFRGTRILDEIRKLRKMREVTVTLDRGFEYVSYLIARWLSNPRDIAARLH